MIAGREFIVATLMSAFMRRDLSTSLRKGKKVITIRSALAIVVKIVLVLGLMLVPTVQAEPVWGSSLTDNDDGLISGTDILGASFSLGRQIRLSRSS